MPNFNGHAPSTHSVASGFFSEILLNVSKFLESGKLIFHQLPDSQETFLRYLRYGGLPYLINLSLSDGLVYDYLRNIYAAILFKDIVARHNIRNVSLLENLVSYVSDNIGNLLSAKSISDFLKSQAQRHLGIRCFYFLCAIAPLRWKFCVTSVSHKY